MVVLFNDLRLIHYLRVEPPVDELLRVAPLVLLEVLLELRVAPLVVLELLLELRVAPLELLEELLELPRLTVDSEPEELTVRMLVSDEPELVTRLLTVVWEPWLVLDARDALLPEVLLVVLEARDEVLVEPEVLPVLEVREALPAVLLEAELVVLAVLDAELEAELVVLAFLVAELLLEVELALRVALREVELTLVTVDASCAARISRAFAWRVAFSTLTPAELTTGVFALRTVNEWLGLATA